MLKDQAMLWKYRKKNKELNEYCKHLVNEKKHFEQEHENIKEIFYLLVEEKRRLNFLLEDKLKIFQNNSTQTMENKELLQKEKNLRNLILKLQLKYSKQLQQMMKLHGIDFSIPKPNSIINMLPENMWFKWLEWFENSFFRNHH